MRAGDRVQIGMLIHGQTQLMVGKIKIISGRLAWVKWDDGRVSRVFLSQLEANHGGLPSVVGAQTNQPA